MTVTLNAEKRDETKSAKSLRTAGILPGVVYGPKQAPLSVALSKKEFDKVFKTAGESTVIDLTGLGSPMQVLVKDVDFAPTKGGIMHVDFYAIEKGKKITATVPLDLVGESPAVKDGGVINHILHEIEVTCMPADLPSHIDVDISGLAEIGAQIHVSDLKIGKGVEIDLDAEEVVVLIGEPAPEEVEAPVAAVDMSAIEVEKKGKAEEPAE
jgi:large subunit ribosomal protein L25